MSVAKELRMLKLLEEMRREQLRQGEALERIEQKANHIMTDFSKLQTQVTAIKSAADAAKTFMEGISKQLRDLQLPDTASQAIVDGFADSLATDAKEIGDAIEANTPGAPATPPDTGTPTP